MDNKHKKREKIRLKIDKNKFLEKYKYRLYSKGFKIDKNVLSSLRKVE